MYNAARALPLGNLVREVRGGVLYYFANAYRDSHDDSLEFRFLRGDLTAALRNYNTWP